MDGGHDAYAKIDGAAADLELEAPVLRFALFRDIQLGHDLNAADDGRGEAAVDGFGRGV